MGARHPGHSSERVAAARRDGVGQTVETKSGAALRLYDAPKVGLAPTHRTRDTAHCGPRRPCA